MVDAMANSVEDYLIEGLSFKLSPGASYVTDRRSVSYFTAGSNVYQSGSGARVIRINLTGDGWLDPSTVRLVYTLVNSDAEVTHTLKPLSGGWSFFRRARCLVGGAILDDVDYYNRVHEMLHILTSKNNRDNDEIEGFGNRWDSDTLYNKWTNALVGGIKGGSTGNARTVSFKPLFGILNQPKYIPLSWCPMMMEFEVVNGATDAIFSPISGNDINAGNTSTTWQIQDVRVVCDLVTLDSALQNSYAEHVLSGKNLPINYSTYVSQFQTLTSSDFAINVSRAVTRLKSVFINFDNRTADNVAHKNMNTFVSSMTDTDFVGADYDYSKELQWQLQIGSKMFPEYPVRSLAETFYQLKKALGIHGSAFHSLSITPDQFRNDHFIIGIDTEKILEAGFTGLNTRSGDLMVVRGKYANSNSATTWANAIYMILHTDQILEIRDTGCQVYD
jgi:hypothetical protein